MKPQVLRSMADETGSTDEADTSKSSRKQVSKRAFLAADGSEAERIEEAAGARYTLLGSSGKADGTDAKHFDVQFGNPGSFVTMCAIFGFHTKVGNVANTVLNDKEDPGTPDDAATAISEFISQARDAGIWAERSAGGVGAKIDKDALAGAIVEVAAAAGKTVAYDQVRQWLEEGRPADAATGRPAMTAQAYTRASRQVPDVAAAYATRVGKATKSVTDLI